MEHEQLKMVMAAILFAAQEKGGLDNRIVKTLEELDALIAAIQNPGPVKARVGAYRQKRGLPPEIYSEAPAVKPQKPPTEYSGGNTEREHPGFDKNGDEYLF